MTSYLALGAAGAALLLLLVAWLRGRSHDRVEPDLAAALADVNERMEQLTGDLSAALERARAEGRRGRALGELSGSIDLDEVLTRTLEAATTIHGVDAAVISVRGPGGEQVVAALGVDALDTERATIATPPDGSRARAIRVSYVYEREGGLRSGLAVPLETDGEPLGFLAVYARAGHDLNDEVLTELETLAASAGPAVDNARRFREARQLADMDALTGLHNRRYFHETLAREVARAHRYDRPLALAVLDLDDFKAINDRIGHLAGDAVLAEAAERVRDVVRSADVACRVGGDEFAIILPESTRRRRRGALPASRARDGEAAGRPGRDARTLGGRRRAQGRGRCGVLLRASRRGPLPGEERGQGHRRGRRAERGAAAAAGDPPTLCPGQRR